MNIGIKKNRFTLVEIMIVLGIVGILSAIALPNFAQYREDSLERNKEANIKMVQMAKEQWKLDNPGVDGSFMTVDDIKNYLTDVDTAEDLEVSGLAITIGGLGEDPYY